MVESSIGLMDKIPRNDEDGGIKRDQELETDEPRDEPIREETMGKKLPAISPRGEKEGPRRKSECHDVFHLRKLAIFLSLDGTRRAVCHCSRQLKIRW